MNDDKPTIKNYRDYHVLESFIHRRGEHNFIQKVVAFPPYPSKDTIKQVAKALTPPGYRIPTGHISGTCFFRNKKPIISYYKFTFAPIEVEGIQAIGW